MKNGYIVMNGEIVENNCYAEIKGVKTYGVFLGFYQYSDVIPPSNMAWGHKGGTVAFPMALVRVGDEVKEYRAGYVKFIKSNMDLEIEEKMMEYEKEYEKYGGESDEDTRP